MSPETGWGGEAQRAPGPIDGAPTCRPRPSARSHGSFPGEGGQLLLRASATDSLRARTPLGPQGRSCPRGAPDASAPRVAAVPPSGPFGLSHRPSVQKKTGRPGNGRPFCRRRGGSMQGSGAYFETRRAPRDPIELPPRDPGGLAAVMIGGMGPGACRARRQRANEAPL